MKLSETLTISTKYDQLCNLAATQTDAVFEELRSLYQRELEEAMRETPELVEVPEQEYESRFEFRIKGVGYTLFQNKEPALVKDLSDFTETADVFSFPLKHVTENAEISRHLAGCITLSMKFEHQYSSVMRIFVNHLKEAAFEYAIGWKQPFLFRNFDEIGDKSDIFFTEPVTQSLLGVTPRWKSLDEIEIVDDIRDLMASDNLIGFIP